MRKLVFALLVGAAGCAGSAGYSSGGYATATVSADMPDMVYVSDGVQVIADYDEPVFYTDGYYWRYNNNTWYRSHSYTGGWTYARPSQRLLRIDRPYAYVRYRPSGYVARRPARRDTRPVYRNYDNDRRDYRDSTPTPVYRNTTPAPVYRNDDNDRREYRPAQPGTVVPPAERRSPLRNERDPRRDEHDRREREKHRHDH